MRTLAEALDALLRGELAAVGDLLMQRLKALEVATKDGDWHVARQLELIPENDVGLAAPGERREAQRSRRLELRYGDGDGGKGRSRSPRLPPP